MLHFFILHIGQNVIFIFLPWRKFKVIFQVFSFYDTSFFKNSINPYRQLPPILIFQMLSYKEPVILRCKHEKIFAFFLPQEILYIESNN